MIATIPLSLTEILQPDELGRLLDVAKIEKRTPEDVIVMALRSFLARQPNPQSETPERAEVPA
jgi:hypothetical protein